MTRICEERKDTSIMAKEENLKESSTVQLSEPESDSNPQPGLILEDGSINWDCPCLGGMASGPCGIQFREAFSCFHYSTDDPKGSNCVEAFSKMQDCMQRYPELYGANDEDDEVKKDIEKDSPTPISDSNKEKEPDKVETIEKK